MPQWSQLELRFPASNRTQHTKTGAAHDNSRVQFGDGLHDFARHCSHPFHCGWCTPRSAKLGFEARTALDGPVATRAGAVRGAFWLGPGWGTFAVRLGVRGEFSP